MPLFRDLGLLEEDGAVVEDDENEGVDVPIRYTVNTVMLGRWKSVFSIKDNPPNRQFTGTIETDGVGVCIHYRVPKKRSGIYHYQLKN